MSTTLELAERDAVILAYRENADYDTYPGSISKASAFAAACRKLLIYPKSAILGSGGEQISYEPSLWAEQAERAQKYIAAKRASANQFMYVRYCRQ